MRRLVAVLAAALSVALLVGPAQAANPGWIVSCNYSHSSNDDPIVFPGQPGAAHLHDFLGATSTNAASTGASLQAGGTTCVVAGDHAAYWSPAAYRNGLRILPNATARDGLFYYRRIGAPTGVTVQPFPVGLKMIVGNAAARSAAENPRIASGDIVFKCGPGSTTNLMQPPTSCSSGVMVVSYRFPNCWNGRDLDSPDHISHMAYPSGGRCPSTHPVVLPRVESFLRYPVPTSGQIGEVTFSSGPYYTAHQDFMNGWIAADLQSLVTRCINGGRDCGTNPSP